MIMANWKEDCLNCQWLCLWDCWAQLFLSVKIGGSGKTKTETKAPLNPILTTSQCSLGLHWWFLTLPWKSLQRGIFYSVLSSVLLPHLQGSHPSCSSKLPLLWLLPGKTTRNGIIWNGNFSQIQYSNEHIIPQRLFVSSFSSVMF